MSRLFWKLHLSVGSGQGNHSHGSLEEEHSRQREVHVKKARDRNGLEVQKGSQSSWNVDGHGETHRIKMSKDLENL